MAIGGYRKQPFYRPVIPTWIVEQTSFVGVLVISQ